MKTQNTSGLLLGIDLGGTNTAFGVVDKDGRMYCRGNIPTTGYPSFDEYVNTLYKEVIRVMTAEGYLLNDIVAIGIGAPCMNPHSGVIEGAVNLPWPSPIPLTEVFSRIFDIPAFGENDANAAALGEMYFGAGRGMDNFIMLTLGTGVGSAIICDGRLLRGQRGLAGELGHVAVIHGEDARMCNCGRRGCLDAYASARGITATACELIEKTDIPSSLREAGDIDSKTIGRAAEKGDPLALEVMRITGEILGEACAQFTAFSSPEAFIFFGGVAKSFPLFEAPMRKAFEDNLLWVYKGQVEFMASKLPAADAAVFGAAAVAGSRIKQI